MDYVGCWRIDYVACWRTGHGDHRPTIVSKAIHSPPSLDLWSLARARRGGGSRVSGAGVGLLGQVPLEKCRKHRKVPLEKC